MRHETRYKLCIFCENCARDTPLLGVYIPKFGNISVKFSVFVVLYLIVTLMGVKFGMEERTKFHSPSVQIEQCVTSAGQKKPQSCSWSNLNTGTLLCANVAGNN